MTITTLAPLPDTASWLVATEHGIGFYDSTHGELRKPHVVHVSPKPKFFEAVTAEGVEHYYTARTSVRESCTAYYATSTYTGD